METELYSYVSQILLREGCKKILVADSLSLLKKMHRTQKRGVLVDEESICEACLSPILPTNASEAFRVTVFHCRHLFHKECIPEPNTNSSVKFCNICSAKHRGPGSAILEMKK
ncbi:UNVERIFIED_CONTAM: Vacuolar protein sorting-associated protein 41 [Gekko kuhli]